PDGPSPSLVQPVAEPGLVPAPRSVDLPERDTVALPPPAKEESAETDAEEWANGFQRMVAEAWRDVLGQATVRRQDDFLDLGGDSILALQISSRLKQALPIPLKLDELFKARSVTEMAEMLELEVIDGIDALPEETILSLLNETR
ncbi:phosphopantetheine-binding protein, partial [Rhizobium sp.]|uniref:phosphopantetheine-binding protein n=1 Tax=Rhizobium sp. TaxID=391 RepID=UPI002AA7073C